MATNTTTQPPAEVRTAERNGAAAGNAVVDTMSNAATSIAGAASSGASSVSGWWNHVYATYQKDGVWAAVKDAFGGILEGISGFMGMSGDPEKDKNSLNWKSILGSLGFAAGGWMLGSAFGGGYLGMIFGAGLALVGAVMGAQFGNSFNNSATGPKRAYAPASGTPVQYVGAGQQQQQGTGAGIDFSQIVDRVPAAAALPYDGQMLAQYSNDVRTQYASPAVSNGQLAGVGYAPAAPGAAPANATYSFVNGGLPRSRF